MVECSGGPFPRVAERPGPQARCAMTQWIIRLWDWRDDRRARRLRRDYGHHGWLVSWRRLRDDRWLVRLSCPERPETIARRGRSRTEAIRRADAVLRRAIRDEVGP